MTRIDFYLLASAEVKPLDIICRLIDKAYQRGHRLFVYTETMPEAEMIDEALWTFRDDSFIPHLLQNEGSFPPPPVQLGPQEPSSHFNDILVNCHTQIPSWFHRFNRVLEIVPEEETAKVASRERYRQYRAAQCEVMTHNLT